MVMAIMLFATVIAIYAFWIRPILQSRPAFRDLCDKEENFFAALRVKFAGIKQKLSSAVVICCFLLSVIYSHSHGDHWGGVRGKQCQGYVVI